MGAGMELVVGKHLGRNQEGLVECQEKPEHLQSVRRRH